MQEGRAASAGRQSGEFPVKGWVDISRLMAASVDGSIAALKKTMTTAMRSKKKEEGRRRTCIIRVFVRSFTDG